MCSFQSKIHLYLYSKRNEIGNHRITFPRSMYERAQPWSGAVSTLLLGALQFTQTSIDHKGILGEIKHTHTHTLV